MIEDLGGQTGFGKTFEIVSAIDCFVALLLSSDKKSVGGSILDIMLWVVTRTWLPVTCACISLQQ
ncbi:hypothetical protein SLEP1_g23303 [Rubroshorea leprosula]|uniref:Uncharacterized protein n=1 Tax=Rubroshorea leprosula TaxID=152421 RepID=A0AAV5JL94_9ROSI|nr:hypothetical protein SLEP1_g23303 [Rubroshorea leprosula]